MTGKMKTPKIGCFKPSCLPVTYFVGVLTTSLVLILASVTTGISAEKEKVKETTAITFPMDCRPYHLRSMKFMLKNFNKCSRELKANSATDKDYEENIGCAMKCTMRATGYTENDLVTVETIKRSVGKLLPTALVDGVAQTLIEKCHNKYGEKLNPSEAQCRSYSEYAFCIQNCVADIIDSEWCIKYDKNGKPIPSVDE